MIWNFVTPKPNLPAQLLHQEFFSGAHLHRSLKVEKHVVGFDDATERTKVVKNLRPASNEAWV